MNALRAALSLLLMSLLCSCVVVPASRHYTGPIARPAEITDYYAIPGPYTSKSEETLATNDLLSIKRIKLNTPAGATTIDFYQRHEKNPNLILVFPLLGGSNVVSAYFADYFAKRGVDTAIVHRSEDFKNPAKFDQIEKVLRENVIRDRIALDLFEKEYGKTSFGGFGISRGAINLVITAGADARLKYNVAAMGGSDLMRIMKSSNERRIVKYRNDVMSTKGISESEFNAALKDAVRTDPKYLAQYVDARTALLILCVLDKTVPIQYGIKLRREMGGPKTVYLLADHYLSAGFTRLVDVTPLKDTMGVFPFDYIEHEALVFYERSFKLNQSSDGGLLPFRIFQAPFNMIASFINWLW